jgi:hypothetical protein
MVYKTQYRKLKIEQHEPHYKPEGELRYSGRVVSSWSTSDTRSFKKYIVCTK